MIMENFYQQQIIDILIVKPTGAVRLDVLEEFSP